VGPLFIAFPHQKNDILSILWPVFLISWWCSCGLTSLRVQTDCAIIDHICLLFMSAALYSFRVVYNHSLLNIFVTLNSYSGYFSHNLNMKSMNAVRCSERTNYQPTTSMLLGVLFSIRNPRPNRRSTTTSGSLHKFANRQSES
jgi:hypothetical protein